MHRVGIAALCVLAGSVVTYQVVVTNQGNILLGNTNLVSNVVPALTNQSALLDGLDVGEVVVLQSNITYNNSMIRAGNMSLSTNVTATGVTANVSATSAATIYPRRCANNDTVRE